MKVNAPASVSIPESRPALHEGLLAGRPRLQRRVEGWPHRGVECEEIIDAIARYSVTKDRDLIRTVIPAALHPDGEVNVDGLAKDLAFIKTLGLVKSNVAVPDIVDMSFAKAAVAELGPYKGRTG